MSDDLNNKSSDGSLPVLGDEITAIDEVASIRIDWHRWWAQIPEIVAFLCGGALPVFIFINVISRYTDWYRVPWSNDVVQMLFVWLVFLGGALAVKYDAHVRMSMLVDRMMGQGSIGRFWAYIVRLSPVAMGVILLFLGFRAVELDMKRLLTWLQIPSGYFESIIPVSGALMIYYAARSAIRLWLHEHARTPTEREE